MDPSTTTTNFCDVRWSWKKFPASRIDGSRMVVPLGCLYTPMAKDCPKIDYQPPRCVCKSFLNPHCPIDYRSKTWGCVICGTRNSFPTHYTNMSEQQQPVELWKQYDTVEYVTPQAKESRPTVALVIDTCVDTEEELAALRSYVQLSLTKIPEDTLVCLITFGATVQLHDLSGSTDYNKSLVFRGSAQVSVEAMKRAAKDPSKYVAPFGDAEIIISSLIDELDFDVWPVSKQHRPLRCTGAALSAASALLEIASNQVGSMILAFISGVCTEGPGLTVDSNKENMIRVHTDLRDSTPAASHYEKAVGFYDTLMRKLVHHGHSLSLFVGSLDQAGIAEMRVCVQATGGVVISSDSWARPWIRQSLASLFQRREDETLALALNATIDVLTSPTWKVMGTIGPCIGTGRSSPCVSDSEIGMGGTCQWTSCVLDHSSTLAVFFEPAMGPLPNQPGPAASKNTRFVQFITKYQTSHGAIRTRVTTLPHAVVTGQVNFQEIGATLDQQVATVLLAKMAVFKTDSTALFDVLRWLDRNVIRLVARFCDYQKDLPHTLKFPPQLSFFPQFMYHLRRSAYLSVFNSSPDETAVLRLLLLRANCNNGIVMIMPSLTSYTLSQPPRPVALDSSAMQHDNIILMDTFFEVMIVHGEMIQAWREQGYEENPEYDYFKTFLQQPREEAARLIEGRYPAPRFLEIHINQPDARIFKHRINPSRTHNTSDGGSAPGELVYTDDVSLQTFVEHLKKLAVQQ